jgi:hypothetical protein
MRLTIIATIALSLTMWMAAKCDEDLPICSEYTITDQVAVSVVPVDVNLIPDGTYLLKFIVDEKELEIEWTMSNANGRSHAAVRDNTGGYFYEIRVVETDLINATVRIVCPESKLKQVDAILFLNGMQIDNITIDPVYGDDQPTEPNGEKCGKCWKMNLGVQTLMVPIM